MCEIYFMKITRWNSDLSFDFKANEKLLNEKGIDYKTIDISPGKKINNLRAHFNETLTINQGELIFNFTGTQFGLKVGDKLEIPSNTIYSISNLKDIQAQLTVIYSV